MTSDARRSKRAELWLLSLVALGATFSPSCRAGENTMDLKLNVTVDRSQYLYGESILARVTLRNEGKQPLDLPSVRGNDIVTGYRILDAQGKEIDTVYRIDFQERSGAPRVHGDRVRMLTLAPGESDSYQVDLLLWHDPLPAGRYQIAGVYEWDTYELASEPAPIEILPSHPGAFAAGFNRVLMEPQNLMFAWVDRWQDQPLLMEAATLGPNYRLLEHTRRIENADVTEPVQQLALARDLDYTGAVRSTVLWKDAQGLRWRAVGPTAASTVGVCTPNLVGWRIVEDAYLESGSTTIVLLSDAGHTEVVALGLASDGGASEIGRHQGPAALRQAFLYRPDAGPLYVYAVSIATGTSLRWERMGGTGGAGTIVDSQYPVAAIAVTFNGQDQPAVVAAFAGGASGDQLELHTHLYQGAHFEQESRGPVFRVPRDGEVQLGLGTKGSIHCLVETQAGKLLYASESGPVEPSDSLEGIQPPGRLVVGAQGRAFVVGHAKPGGVALAPCLPLPTIQTAE
jgi:hypothetical protein